MPGTSEVAEYQMKFLTNKKYVWVAVGAVLIIAVILFFVFGKNNIDINSSDVKGDKIGVSALAGIECGNYNSRPYAVMLSSDKEARPLSGIAEADVVFEMPVVNNGFTRMMAVYQCNRPNEVGSIRSSRLDFLPLALGLNAIYAHFGGEHEVLEELNKGVIDNIDGLKYDGTIYYRKGSIPRPHNAFTDFSLLAQAVTQLGYKTDNTNIVYPHDKNDKSVDLIQPPTLFNKGFDVVWKYDQAKNSYLRWRAGSQEIDKNNLKQVDAKNVVIMKTTWAPINKDYIRVKTVGSGQAVVYKNGEEIKGTWDKKDDNSKQYFYDLNNKEIKFTPGNIWIEIDAR